MKFNKHLIYISLFAILYLIVAFSSFWHAVAFFGLANNSWMSIILAGAFEIGQSAVLFSLLTSTKDRSRIMPWVLMTMFTLVQIIGNVYSSYKYIITNSVDNLRYFKEPIFIWTDLPDAQANVIIVYLVGALLPLCSLMLTSMITNYLTDVEENKIEEQKEPTFLNAEGDSLLNQNSILNMENQGLHESLDNKDKEIEELKEDHDKIIDEKFEKEQQLKDALEKTGYLNNSLVQKNDEIDNLKKQLEELKHPKIPQIPVNEINNVIPFSEPTGLKEIKELKQSKEIINETNEDEEPLLGDRGDDQIQQKHEKIEQSSDKENNDVSENIKKHQSNNSSGETKDSNQSESSKEIKHNDEINKENNEVDDENLKMAAALIGGNVPNKNRVNSESHFINNDKK